jgi:hypothetical protein
VTLNADLRDAVVGRTALDSGTPDDVDPFHHGTSMAMIAASAHNGIGMIGAWPALHIFSVRAAAAAPPGQHATFAFANYARAIRVCLGIPNVAAIVLALGGEAPASDEETATFVDKVTKSHALGVNVIAAAGNDGGPVNTPARLPGVIAVGAGDGAGVLCSFSSRGAGLDLIAPGCGLDTADPVTLERLIGAAGSSQAALYAVTAAFVALRSYRRDLSWAQTEALVLDNAPAGVIDIGRAFRAAGLGDVVDAGRAAMPADPASGSTVHVGETTAPGTGHRPSDRITRFTAPRVRVARCHAGRVVIRIARRPRDALVVVRLLERAHTRDKLQLVARRRVASRSIEIRRDRCPSRVEVRFDDRYGARALRSPTTVAQIGRR